jgi:outer membrane protein assembly factor BamB
VSEYVEGRWFDPLSAWRRNVTTGLAVGSLLALIVGGGGWLYASQLAPKAKAALSVPGAHLWVAEQHDAHGTFWADAIGPRTEPQVTWAYQHEGGFAGGPVVASDGTVYVTTLDNELHAISAQGEAVWQTPLPGTPFNAPALGELGDVYVVSDSSELYAVSSQGTVRWAFTPSRPAQPLSSPIVGLDGTIYYSTEMALIAVTVDGVRRWEIPLPSFSYASPLPRLSADGAYVFFEDVIVDAHTGATVFAESPEPLDKYMIGTNGGIYLRQQAMLLEWKATDEGATLSEWAKWDARSLNLGFRFPNDAGVLPDGRAWVYYYSGFEFAKLLWLDAQHQPLTPIDYPYRGFVRLIGFDTDGVVYLCGVSAETDSIECRANEPGSNAPLWKLPLAGVVVGSFSSGVGAPLPTGSSFPVGGAIVPGRVYVLAGNGTLYALEAGP